jgi:hypothetical protein
LQNFKQKDKSRNTRVTRFTGRTAVQRSCPADKNEKNIRIYNKQGNRRSAERTRKLGADGIISGSDGESRSPTVKKR